MKRLRDKVMQLSAKDDLGNEELIEVLLHLHFKIVLRRSIFIFI
jgi:hypothetical protein